MSRNHVLCWGILTVVGFVTCISELSGEKDDYHVGAPPQVEQVLNNYRRAAGGAARVSSITTLLVEGNEGAASSRTDGSPVLIHFASPDQLQRLDLAPSNNALGPLFATTVTGQRAWILGFRSVAQGPVTTKPIVSEAERLLLKTRRSLLEAALGMVPDVLMRTGQVTFSEGPTERDGSKTLTGLIVSDEGGPFGTLYFDANTHLPVRFQLRFLLLAGEPSEMTRVTEYLNYRATSGVQLPMVIAKTTLGTRLTINRYVINAKEGWDFAEPSDAAGRSRLLAAVKAVSSKPK